MTIMAKAPRTQKTAKGAPEATAPEIETPEVDTTAADSAEDATPHARKVVREAMKTVESARETAAHAAATVELGREAIPEVGDLARAALDEQMDRYKAKGQEAAEAALDQMEVARTLILDQVKSRPITAALAAVGAGFFLGVLLTGRRR
jgi:ElaB/YqjD/DUF883 family membrane-anchored ribosome-binding protein